MARGPKRPKFGASPNVTKQVPPIPGWVQRHNAQERRISWRFSFADRDGPYPWVNVPAEVYEAFGELERLDFGEAIRTRCHSIEIADLCKDAQERLRELQRDDIDRLYGWRITGPARVWCAMYGDVMYVLWWDPDHLVYPVGLRHT